MKESGTLQATIVGDQAEVNSSFRNLSESNQERLDNLAHKYLVQAVKKAHTNATEKQIFVKAFKDECPHCHKPQSWAVSNAKKEMFTWPVVIVIAGIIAGVALRSQRFGLLFASLNSAIRKNRPQRLCSTTCRVLIGV